MIGMARPAISRLLGGRGGSPLMPRRAARLTIRLVESFGTVDPVSPPPPDAATGFAGGRVLCWRRGLPAPLRWRMHRRVGWFVSSPLPLSGRRSLDSWGRRRCTAGHDRTPARRAPLGQWPSRPRSDALRWAPEGGTAPIHCKAARSGGSSRCPAATLRPIHIQPARLCMHR